MPKQQFLSCFYRRVPFAQPNAAAGFIPLFDWETLGRVLSDASASAQDDVLVVRGGRLMPSAVPRSLPQARAVLESGASLVVRRAEQRDTGLAELARSFATSFAGAVQIQLFVTPKSERGFGWHYDAEDVFILQTSGSKEYFFRQNTINPRPKPQPRYDFAAIRQERTPIMACTLAAGDWLYLPGGWWHVANAQSEDSLAISLGLLAPAGSASLGVGDAAPGLTQPSREQRQR